MTGIEVRVTDLSVAFASRPILDRISLTLARSEILAIVGPSGCGKSTLLRALAGLQPISGGAVLLDGRHAGGPSKDRGMVFQEDALLPWRTVGANVELPLRLQGVPRADSRRRANEMLDRVGLADDRDLLPRQLSGGMRQRAQIARTLVGEPGVVLMDEPFSALDAHTRLSAQQVLLDAWRIHRPTVVFVTHDLDEALSIGHRLLVLSGSPATTKLLANLPEGGATGTETERAVSDLRAAVLEILQVGNR